jgi:hypothetical protein
MALSSAAPGTVASGTPGRSSGATVARARGDATRWLLRTLLIGGAALAVGVTAVSGDPAAYLRADPALGTLLRGMGAIKALLTAAAVAALLWRFARPVGRREAALYLAGAWCMAAASMLVWRLSHIGMGALVFHAGELTLLFTAWQEHRRETVGGRPR